MTRLAERLGVRLPLVQAPMAGSTPPELVAAVSEAGALGSFGAAVSSPDALREAIREIRARTDAPFAVNLFAPLAVPEADPDAVAETRAALERHGEPGEPRLPPWSVDDQLAVVLDERPPVLSFTFGTIDTAPLRAAGIAVLGTATTVEEARELERAGVDAVVAQGAEAGGHRGTFLGSFEDGLVPLERLVREAVDAVGVPVVAAGGLMDGADVARALAHGAEAAQLGTAFLFCPEAGVTGAWRRALRQHETVVTAAYTGRPARAARTAFLAELEAGPGPLPFPLQAMLLRPFRERDGYGLYMGGTAAARGRELPAGELVQTIAGEAGLL